uniref:uncharacterized protein LOC120343914 isoform X27 n=1 Tax=Styela clava TaxID=7725 RepID=UPI00193A47D5|nr:uncharacterized protein LOC120343914 isoform X27 [Styela clava]
MLRVVHLLLWGLFLPALFRKSEVVGLDQTLEPECGGFLLASDTQEVISSPPSHYETTTFCNWTIQAPADRFVKLQFQNIDLDECCNKITVSQADLEKMDTIAFMPENSYYSYLGGSLNVVFESFKTSDKKTGFRAVYVAEKPGVEIMPPPAIGDENWPFKTTPTDPRTDAPFDDCGGEIIVRGDGKINSPGYPMKYRGGLDCWWRLATENDDHRISIEFETVETENCCDFVEVYDGNDLQKKLRGTYYTAPVYNFTSTGNTVRIHFHSDNENEMKGFSAYFILEIGSKMPPISPSNATFIGTTDVPSVVTGTIPVSSILSTIQSVASTISMAEEQTTTIKTTTLPVQTTTQSPECGETSLTASDSANRLQFPPWRSTFSGGILCVWSIRAPEGLEIELEFSYIDVNECCDFIEVLVKDGADEGIQFHHFTSLPGVSYVVPVGGVIKVTYNTFGLMPTGGFRATYYTRLPEGITMMISTSEEPTTVVETTAIISEFTTTPIGKTTSALSIPSLRPKSCERTLRKMDIGKVYVLQSPDRDSSNCRWRFRAARGLSIRFRFIEFDIQPQYGNFTILDAPKFKVNWDKAKALQIINGKRDGFVVEVDHYLTAVKYNIIARQPGFVLVYESFLPIGECGYTARATEKDRFMKSPGWPKRPFKGHIKCNWTIESAVKRKEVSFDLLEFYAPSEGDSLMIYDGSKLLANIQDSLLAPTFYTSTKGKLQIIYEGMEHDDLKGFHGVYKIDLPTTASPTTAEKTTFRAVRPSVVNTPTATATAVCISVQLLTEVTTNMLSTTDLPTTASPTTAEGTTFSAARPSVVNTPTATATAVQLLTEVTNILSTTGPPTTPSSATDAPGYSTVGISVAISASATTATVQLMTDVATKMLLNTDADKPTTPSLDTYVNNSTLSSDTDALTYTTDADKPTTPSSDTYVNNSTLSSDTDAPTDSTAAISIAMSPSATTAAAQLLTDVFTKVSSTTGPIPAIKCYEILISGVPGNPNNMKNAAQCLPGHKCVLVKSQLQVPLTETTIESVYGSCVPESICLQDTCREISEVFPMLGSNCTSYCCDEDFCNDYKMPEPEVTAAPQLKCYSIVETSAVGKTSQLTQMNVQECAAGSTCLYVKVLASMTIGETSSKVSSVTSFGNCFPKALKETYGCEQIFSSMNSLNPGIAMSVISCGVYFCDTDLCNSPQSVEIIIPNIDNEETTTEKAVEQTTAPSITSTGSSTTGIDCFDMLQVSLTGKPPVHDVKNTTSCDLGWKCVYAEAEMESDGIFLQVIYGTCVPNALCDNDPCNQIATILPDLSMDYNLKRCTARCCEQNLCNERISTAIVESTTIHTVSTFMLQTVSTPILTTPDTDPNTLQCYSIQKIESSLNYLNADVNNVLTCSSGSVCYFLTSEYYISVGNVRTKVKMTSANCRDSCQDDCSDLSRVIQGSSGVNVDVQSCTSYCCSEDLCNADKKIVTQTTQQSITDMNATHSAIENSSEGLMCYNTLIADLPAGQTINQQAKDDCGNNSVCMLVTVDSTVYTSDSESFSATMVFGSCFPASSRSSTSCEQLLSNIDIASTYTNGNVTFDKCILSFCHEDFCNNPEASLVPHIPDIKEPVGPSIQCYVINNVESKFDMLNQDTKSITMCPAGSSCHLIKADVHMRTNLFSTNVTITNGRCIASAFCEYSDCKQFRDFLPSEISEVSYDIIDCKSSCCSEDLCNDIDEIPVLTTMTSQETTVVTKPPGITKGLLCYTTLITDTSGYKAINQQTETDCGEDAVCVLLQVESSVLSDYGTSKVTTTYGSCFSISARDYTGCELMLNDVQKESAMSASIKEVTIENCRLSFCETNLCNDHNGPPLPTHVPSVVITDAGEPIECYVIQNIESPMSVVNSKSQTIRQCPAGSSCQLVEADMSFSGFGGFGSSMKVVTGNCILTAMCKFSNCEQMKNLLPSNVAGVSFTLNSCKTSCCDSNLCNGVDVEEDTTYKPGEYTTQSVITTGLSCYTTLITEISEYKLINEQTETDCGKDAVCVLLQVESSVLSDYDYGSEVLTIYGSCFPISARDYTGCELMFNDVQEQSGMSASTDNVTIESCRLSFCETNLCNDHTGPPLPTHVPTVNITGKAVECHVIQYVESSLTALNRKSHTRTQCSIGQSCQLVEAHMLFSSQLVGFNVNAKITNGNCIPTPMCEFANCHQLKDLMPTNLDGISFEIINCTASCCEGDLCNAVKTEDDVDESTNIPIASTWYSDTTGPSSGAIICYQTLIASSDGVRSVIEKRESWCGEESLCMLISIYGTVTLPGSASNGSVIYGSCVPKLARDSATCEFMMREIKGASGSSTNLDQLTVHSCNLSFCETNLCNDETGPPLSIHVPSTKVTVPTELLECYVINNFVSGDLTVDHYTRKTTCLPGSSCSLLESRIEVTSEYTGHSTNLTLVSGNCVNTAWCRDINCKDLPDLLPENVGMTERILQCKLSCCSENLCNALTQKNVDEEPTDTPSPTYSVPTADSKLKCYNTLISESSGYRSLDQQEEVDCDEDSLCMLVNVHLYVTVLGIKSEVFTIYGMCYPKAAKDYATCDQIISKLGTAESINLKVENCDLSFCEKNLCNDHSEFLISKNATEPDNPIQCYVRQKVESDFPGIARDESSISTCAVGLICQTMTADMKIHSGFMNITMKVTVGNCVETSMCELSNCKYLNNLMPDSLQGLNGEVTGCKTKCCSDNLCNFGEDGLKYTTATTAPSYTVPGKSVRVSRCYETLISKTSGIQALNQQKEVDCDEDSICMLLNVQSMVSIVGIETKVSTIYGSCYPKLAKLYTTCERMMSQVPALGSSSNMKVEKCSLSFCEEDLCNDHTKLVNQTKPSTTLQCYHMQHVDSDYSDVKKNELSTINCALGSSCQTMVADLRIISGYMNTSMKVTVGSCTPTAMCELNNCEYLNNVLPSSLQGLNFEVTGCKAACCSDSLCNYREDGLLNTTSTHGLKYTASTFAPSYTSPDIFDTDCYTGIGVDYRGFVSETVSGRSCQRWDSQSPHEHVRTPERFPYKGIINNNYCRNPDQEGTRPWCYTTDSGLRWEYCPVQQCSDPLRTNPVPTIVTEGEFATTDILPTTTKDVKEISCFFGTLETMVDDIHIAPDKDTKQCGQGFKCMLIQVIAYSPTVLTGSGVSKIVVTYGDCLPISTNCSPESCLPILSGTQDFSSEANITSCDITCCDTNLCNEPMKVSTTRTVASTLVTIPYTDCYTGIGVDYRGSVSVTVTGRTCQRWDLQTPHEHIRTPERFPYKGIINNNYCRNPDQEGTRPWCYTTDRGQRWEYCPVSKCSDTLPTTPFTTTATEQESTASNYVTTTPEESQAISCFHGLLETRADGVQLLSEKKIKTCGQGFVCMLITADAYAPSLLEKSENSEIMMIYGDCLPSSEYCSHERCLPILSTTQDFSSGLNLTSCDVTCCDTDLCNDPKTVLPTQPLVTTATTTPVSGMDPRECYNADDGGSSYRGNASTTLMGLTCQRWDSQTPHEHTRSSSRYPSAGLESNYCRNPDDSDAPWCYTIDADQRWEYCSIRVCQVQTTTQPRTTATNAIFKYSTTTYSVVTTSQPQTTATSIAFESTAVTSDICYTTSDAGASYRGLVAVTKSGKTCQQWDFQWPHEHSRTKDNYPLSGLESNYCRNPDGEEAPWCYTTDIDSRWEYCPIPKCSIEITSQPQTTATSIAFESTAVTSDICYTTSDAGASYRGLVSVTKSGKTCQQWDFQWPHEHSRTEDNYPLSGLESNYCRNPDSEEAPWCYTTDIDSRWEYCPIAKCSTDDRATTIQTTVTEGTNTKAVHVSTTSGHAIVTEDVTHGFSTQTETTMGPEKTTEDHLSRATMRTEDITEDHLSNCYYGLDKGTSYRGTTSTTIGGRTCQRWDLQTPHEHTRVPSRYPLSGLDENYCRNPDVDEKPWCYTTDRNKRWEYCAIEQCSGVPTTAAVVLGTIKPGDCYNFLDDGVRYRGFVSTTDSGRKCQRWDAQSPHEHTRTPERFSSAGLENNYCRNPDNDLRPWCYTTDINVRWEYCPVPECGAEETPTTTKPLLITETETSAVESPTTTAPLLITETETSAVESPTTTAANTKPLLITESETSAAVTTSAGCLTMNLDLVLLLDVSRPRAFRKSRYYTRLNEFVDNIVFAIKLGNVTNVSVIQFAQRSETMYDSHDYVRLPMGDVDRLQHFMENKRTLSQMSKRRAIYHNIEDATIKLMSSPRYSDECTKKLIVLFTTGSAADEKYESKAVNALTSAKIPLYISGLPLSKVNAAKFRGFADKLDSIDMHFTNDFADAQTVLLQFLYEYVPELRPEDGDE